MCNYITELCIDFLKFKLPQKIITAFSMEGKCASKLGSSSAAALSMRPFSLPIETVLLSHTCLLAIMDEKNPYPIVTKLRRTQTNTAAIMISRRNNEGAFIRTSDAKYAIYNSVGVEVDK